MTVSPLANGYVQAASGAYGHGSNGPVTRVVMHRMEAPLRVGTAKAIANYFAGGAGGRNVSCHYCVDPGTIIACLQEEDKGYHAPPNAGSIGIEQAGYCANNDWGTPDGEALMNHSAALAADICRRHGLPMVWLSVDDVKAGKHGITSHHNVSAAFGQSSHTDPDPYFPVAEFMAKVTGGAPVTPPPPPPAQPPVTPPSQPPAQPPAHGADGSPFTPLAVDGGFGPLTVKALQWSLNHTGANPPLAVDGDFGDRSKHALQARLNATNGPVAIDGIVGPKTIMALQHHVGASADGHWGIITTQCLQRTLNAGAF